MSLLVIYLCISLNLTYIVSYPCAVNALCHQITTNKKGLCFFTDKYFHPHVSTNRKNICCQYATVEPTDQDLGTVTDEVPTDLIGFVESKSKAALQTDEDYSSLFSSFARTSKFLLRAALVGSLTGLSVVIFKSSILSVQALLYEGLANYLPRPSFYWPLALYPLIGSMVVSLIIFFKGDQIRNGVDSIAATIDAIEPVHNNYNMPTLFTGSGQPFQHSIPNTAFNITQPSTPKAFDPINQFYRLICAVAALGSGCSLGPEGSAVEIGAGFSRLLSSSGRKGFEPKSETGFYKLYNRFKQCLQDVPVQEKHHLFLAGCAAGVAAGFNAPVSGVFFAIECGNRYLSKNTIKLDENSPDGPRADIAAIVLAASLADLVVNAGLHERAALSIQGNTYAMVSPFFELPLYSVLGIFCGMIAVFFTKLRDIFTELFAGSSWGKDYPLSKLPKYFQPMLGGLLCGLVSIFYPQTLFVGYSTLDQLLAGKIQIEFPLLVQLLGLKLVLTSFSLGSGLIGGVFAPSLFFGAIAGTAYHEVLMKIIHGIEWILSPSSVVQSTISSTALSTPFSFDTFVEDFIKSPIKMVDGNVPELAATTTNLMDMFNNPGLFFRLAEAPAYATVGAAATLGALYRSPLTSSMIMFELTQNHDIVLPVLVSTGLAGLFAEIVTHNRRLW